MDVNGRHVLLFRWDFQFLIEFALIYYTVVSQSGVHIEWFSFSLPSVAFSVNVDLFITIEYFPDGFFSWNFEDIISVTEGVDDAYEL